MQKQMTRIPLPTVSRQPGSRAHPFPIQISLQAQEFIQGVLFHATFADIAAGEFVRLRDGVDRVEFIMRERGLAQGGSEEGWQLMHKYKDIFAGTIYQSVLISLNSHWDWYIRKLSEFIRYARSSLKCPTLSNAVEKGLAKADLLPLLEQLKVIESAIGIILPLKPDERQELEEMSLVRNLGLHNRWEIDPKYMKKTKREGLQVGELRLVSTGELQDWHSLLIKLLSSSGLECAKRFNNAPDYPV
jgi:hypothetical protein